MKFVAALDGSHSLPYNYRFPKDCPIKSSLARRDALRGRPSAARAACGAGFDGMVKAMPLQSHPETNLTGVS